MNLVDLFLQILAVQVTLATALFVISLIIKRNDIADVAWGPGVALASSVPLIFYSPLLYYYHYLVFIAIVIWAIRLGVRIGIKNASKTEDPRYKKWREQWGKTFFLRSFLQVFLLQALLMPLIALSAIVLFLSQNSEISTLIVLTGSLVWLTGFVFETVSDWQLDHHIRNKTGGLMTSGLWKYSRHPNYFGEITMWWGIWIFTLTTPWWWLTLISPITISLLIIFVSGIPMLEKQMSKYPGWTDYARKTSPLIPWVPKSQNS